MPSGVCTNSFLTSSRPRSRATTGLEDVNVGAVIELAEAVAVVAVVVSAFSGGVDVHGSSSEVGLGVAEVVVLRIEVQFEDADTVVLVFVMGMLDAGIRSSGGGGVLSSSGSEYSPSPSVLTIHIRFLGAGARRLLFDGAWRFLELMSMFIGYVLCFSSWAGAAIRWDSILNRDEMLSI